MLQAKIQVGLKTCVPLIYECGLFENRTAQMSKSVQKYTVEEIIVQLSVVSHIQCTGSIFKGFVFCNIKAFFAIWHTHVESIFSRCSLITCPSRVRQDD